MARQNIRERARLQLPTGYEGTNVPDDFFMPESGIEDVDRAIFRLFDKDLTFPLQASEGHEGGIKKTPVIFATGERFAVLKRKQPIRDKNGTLVLPLISIRRTGIEINRQYGLHADLGSLTVKKRLSPRDANYQNIINRLGIHNQSNVASPNDGVGPSTEGSLVIPRGYTGNLVITRGYGANQMVRRVGTRRIRDQRPMFARQGHWLDCQLGDNIFEVLTIPFPKFFSLNYEVTFWTQYTEHMNQMLENMLASVEVMGYNFRIQTDKGYWYVAYLQDALNPDDNFTDFSDQERVVKYTFNLRVDMWIAASQNSGALSPFRKFLSAPQVTFALCEINAPIRAVARPSFVPSGDPNDFILEDIKKFDDAGNPIISDSESVAQAFDVVKDPFSREGEGRYLPVLTRNNRGETVASTRIVKKIDEFLF